MRPLSRHAALVMIVATGVATATFATLTPGCGDSTPAATPDMAQPPPYYGNCTAPARPPSGVTLKLEDAFPGRTFSVPLGIVQAPGDAAHFYVWEQGGKVR